MSAYSIPGDFNWEENSTFQTKMSVLGNKIGTLGPDTWTLVCNNIAYVTFDPILTHLTLNQVSAGFNTNLNGDTVFVSSISGINATASAGTISLNSSAGNTNINASGVVNIAASSATMNLGTLSSASNLSGNLLHLNASTLTCDSVNTINITSSLHGIILNAHTSIDIECGPFASGFTLNMGLNAGTATRIGSNSALNTVQILTTSASVSGSTLTALGGTGVSTSSADTYIQGNSIRIAPGPGNTLLEIGVNVTVWSCQGASFTGLFQGDINFNSNAALKIATITGTSLQLGRGSVPWTIAGSTLSGSFTGAFSLSSASGITAINAETLHLSSGAGDAFLDSSTGNIFIGSVGTPQSINIGQGLTGKPTILQGGPTQIFGTDSLELDSVLVNFAAISCAVLNISSAACTTTLDGTNLKVPNLSVQTGAVAAPANLNPAGWSTVIRNDSTGQLAVYKQS